VPAAPERPDPAPFEPAPAGAGEAAPSGAIAGLRPGGRLEEARLAFLDWFGAVQREDESTLSAMLAPEVFVSRGSRSRRRDDLTRDLARRFAGTSVEPQEPDTPVDPATLEVTEALSAGDPALDAIAAPGDLLVSGRVRFRAARTGVVREDVRRLVVRPDGARFVVIAVDRWPPLP
jgi:hypothetical protein